MPLYKSHVNCRLFKISAFMLGVTLGNYRAGDETLKYLSSEVGTRGSLEVKCGQEEPGTPPLGAGSSPWFPSTGEETWEERCTVSEGRINLCLKKKILEIFRYFSMNVLKKSFLFLKAVYAQCKILAKFMKMYRV